MNPTALLYLEIMATHDNTPTAFETAAADLDKATARVKRARAALRAAEQDARPAVAEALVAGMNEGVVGFRAEVQRRSPFSAPVVRAIGEDNGVPPDERYVRTPKTTD